MPQLPLKITKVWNDLNEARKAVIINLAYNMGRKKHCLVYGLFRLRLNLRIGIMELRD